MFNIDIQYTWLLLFLPLVVAAFDWFLLTKRPDVAALTSTFSCLATSFFPWACWTGPGLTPSLGFRFPTSFPWTWVSCWIPFPPA